MAGEGQERFEDYLELEHYLEELQARHVAHPPDELTAAKARIYRMAALFRSASPGESQPRPEFAAELKACLEQALWPTTPPAFLTKRVLSISRSVARPTLRRPSVSRRRLLVGGVAAASVVAGAGIEKLLQEDEESSESAIVASRGSSALVNEGQGTWHFVAMLAEFGESAVRFAADTIIGYVIRNDGGDGDPAPVIAVSAACTHMGCIVQWQNSDRNEAVTPSLVAS